MKIVELARMVHENAVEHGWWEEKRELPEIIALIHSEWSEALEEVRAGRPLAYIIVHDGWQGDPHEAIVERGQDGKYMYCGKEYSGKPEGIAVELIDGCIRILDYMGEIGVEVTDNVDESESDVESLYTDDVMHDEMMPAAHLVTWLHQLTSEALMCATDDVADPMKLLSAMAMALCWVKHQGLDPLAILLEKHAYNKTRPYKHGKKF